MNNVKNIEYIIIDSLLKGGNCGIINVTEFSKF